MQVILKEDIANLGYKDDVVTVKDGYGRNYLIPKGLAVIASPSALKVLAENQRQKAHKLAKIKADAEAVAAALGELKVVITANASAILALSTEASTVPRLPKHWLLSDKKSTARKFSLKILSKRREITPPPSNCTAKFRLNCPLR